MIYTAAQVAEEVGGEVSGDPTTPLSGIASVDLAVAGDLTFAEKKDYFAAAESSNASAILVSEAFGSSDKVLIRVPNARVAIARLLPLFYPPDKINGGVHPDADVAASAQIDPTARIGPGCSVGDRVRVGPRTVLMGGNHIGNDCRIGEDVRIFPNVVVYAGSEIGNRVLIHSGTVIGSDGYGYVTDEGCHRKVLQVGNTVIHDDVEIGANCCVDRAALGSTVIGQGTKIDNMVHIAHNVVMGRHCLVMGQAGIAGSTVLGDYCVIASQAGISGHLKLGNEAKVGAKSGVMRDIPEKGIVLGTPAMPDREMKRQMVASQHLPEMLRRIRELEKQIRELSPLSGDAE